MNPLTIIFIGPQGSGKGTQVEALKKWLKTEDPDCSIAHIETGKPFRALAEVGGYTAEIVKERIDSGNLVPTILTNAFVMQEFINSMQPNSHVILDGFPRDREQAEALDEMLAVYGRESVEVVELDVSDEVVIERMKRRGRADDTDEGIKKRLSLYEELTKPLLQYYKERNNTKMIHVDGSQKPDVVAEEIQRQLSGTV